jgi:hypothetical protein
MMWEHIKKLRNIVRTLMEYIGSNKNPTPTTLSPKPTNWAPFVTHLIDCQELLCTPFVPLPFLAWVKPQEYKLWDIVQGYPILYIDTK